MTESEGEKQNGNCFHQKLDINYLVTKLLKYYWAPFLARWAPFRSLFGAILEQKKTRKMLNFI